MRVHLRNNPALYLLGSVPLAACFIAGFLLLRPQPAPPPGTSELDAARAEITELRRQNIFLIAQWRAVPLAQRFTPSASHTWEHDNVRAMNDGIEPRNSDDRAIPRFTWWDQKGNTQWVQYDFDATRSVCRVSVYWFEDGEGCSVPVSWTLLSQEDGRWKPVETAAAPGVDKDRWNIVEFQPVTTKSLRLEAQLQPGCSGGILEWRVFGTD